MKRDYDEGTRITTKECVTQYNSFDVIHRREGKNSVVVSLLIISGTYI